MKRTIKILIIFLLITVGFATGNTNLQGASPVSKASKTEKFYIVDIKTTAGTISVKLYNQTPLHRDNFVKLCKNGNYNNVLFHRVIKEFMIQSGDPDSKQHEPGKLYGEGDLGYSLPAEFIPELFHKKGVLAAAREGDDVNPERRSSASQFYIVVGKKLDDTGFAKAEQRIRKALKDDSYTISPEKREIYSTTGGTPHLDMQYTIFGEVVKGQEIVDSISLVKTDDNDRPVEDIWIISMEIQRRRFCH
ncbi:MAG: peptidylprolyl isomerase [Bacteroidales bacterium]|nr:peptidylprolyl isomerase [Bacteroidales bacterium]MDD3990339.1 peptidylprolyl isomerase [Bacteroidales bacterium]